MFFLCYDRNDFMKGSKFHMEKPLTRLGALTLIGLSVVLIARWKKRQEQKKQEDEALAEAIREEMENEDH